MKHYCASSLRAIAKRVRVQILRMHAASDASHIASSFSCVDILTTLYFSVLNINPRKPRDQNRDRFVLSKGHAASALYAILAERGFFNRSVLKGYCCNGGTLPGHATRGCAPGVEVSTGSLGHGLAMANGMAFAALHDDLRCRIFALLSDGECDEGSVWESALFAGHHCLENCVAIIDCNKMQAFGKTSEVLNLEPFAEKWRSFGWSVCEVDGHDYSAMQKLFQKIPFQKYKPSCVIAHTIKGKGVSYMENILDWHYKSPKQADVTAALKELK
jgi:transketolase